MNLTENDSILIKLEDLRKKLITTYPNAEIIAVHFLCGNEDALEAIRKSTYEAHNVDPDPDEVY